MHQKHNLLWLSLFCHLLVTVVGQYEVSTSSCVDNGGTVKKGDDCQYICTFTGLPSWWPEFAEITITKTFYTHYGLYDEVEVNETFIVFNSRDGLNPAFQDTGRYSASLEEIGGDYVAVVNISGITPGDSGGYECYMTNDTDTVTSEETFLPVLGADVEPYFTLDEALFAPGQEISIMKDKMQDLMFSVEVSDVIPVPPSASVLSYYPDVGITQQVNFSSASVDNKTFEIDADTGIASSFVLEMLSQPGLGFVSHTQGPLTLTGSYEYSDQQNAVDLTVNFLFAPEDLVCKEPIPVNASSLLEVKCDFLANPAVTFNLTLPNGEVIESTNPRLGVTFDMVQGEIQWHYSLNIRYESVFGNLFGTHNVAMSNEFGDMEDSFRIRDLDTFDVQTTSCVEDRGTILEGGSCDYYCEATGLDSDDAFTIGKLFVVAEGLAFRLNFSAQHSMYNSSFGLNPFLPSDRYKAIVHDNSSATLSITNVFPGDSAGYACYISNKYGEKIKQSETSYIAVVPVLGSGVTVDMFPNFVGPELSLARDELSNWSFFINMKAALPVSPSMKIQMTYPTGLVEMVQNNFAAQHFFDASPRDPNTGIHNMFGWESYRVTRFDFIKTDQGKPIMSSAYSYAHYQSGFTVPINFLFQPVISCENTSPTLGEPLNFTCQFSTNPPADSYVLQLPGGEIINGTTSNIALAVIAQEVDWQYIFLMSFNTFLGEDKGQYILTIGNAYGSTNVIFEIDETFPETSSEQPQETTTSATNNLTSTLHRAYYIAYVCFMASVISRYRTP